MLQIIVFSFNRAIQLDALINSIFNKWKDVEILIDVIYSSSDEVFENGYSLLKERLMKHGNVHFHKENKKKFPKWSFTELTNLYNLKLLYLCPFLRGRRTDFRDILISILKETIAPCTMFLTDDSVFIKDIRWGNDIEQWIGIDERQHQYSYRHGLELIPDVPLDTDNNSIIFLNEKVYEWSFSAFKKNNHWGYNFSLDAHVYGTKFIYRLLNHASFSNPNTLESCVGLHVGKKNLLTIGRCGEYICILSYPINVVQKVFKNAALNASPRTLNDYYLKGYILEYPPINNITAFQVYPEHVYVTKNAERITLFLERNDHP